MIPTQRRQTVQEFHVQFTHSNVRGESRGSADQMFAVGPVVRFVAVHKDEVMSRCLSQEGDRYQGVWS